MSERIDLLRPLITPAIEKLAHRRLMEGPTAAPLLNPQTGEPIKGTRGQVKIALLLVHILNPFELFQSEEDALLRGISSDTLSRRRGELKKW